MLVKVVSPPSKIATAHSQIIKKLEKRGCLIQDTNQPDVPAIVTIVNSSRVLADIDRDILKAKGTYIFNMLSREA